jgi:hypothetical protein
MLSNVYLHYVRLIGGGLIRGGHFPIPMLKQETRAREAGSLS